LVLLIILSHHFVSFFIINLFYTIFGDLLLLLCTFPLKIIPRWSKIALISNRVELRFWQSFNESCKRTKVPPTLSNMFMADEDFIRTHRSLLMIVIEWHDPTISNFFWKSFAVVIGQFLIREIAVLSLNIILSRHWISNSIEFSSQKNYENLR